MHYVIDRNPTRRAVIAARLSCFEFVVHSFATIDEFLSVFDESTAGVIIFGADSSDRTGMNALTKLLAEGAMHPVVVLAADATLDLCRMVLKAGAKEFLPYPLNWPEVFACLRQCLDDDLTTRGALGAGRNECERVSKRSPRQRVHNLTQREREIMELLIMGATSKEIAWSLKLSPRTVDAHRANIRGKLKGRTFAQMIYLYLTTASSVSSSTQSKPLFATASGH